MTVCGKINPAMGRVIAEKWCREEAGATTDSPAAAYQDALDGRTFEERRRDIIEGGPPAEYRAAFDTRLAEDNPLRGEVFTVTMRPEDRPETVTGEVAALRELAACLGDILFVLKGLEASWSMSAVKKAHGHLDRAMELVGKP